MHNTTHIYWHGTHTASQLCASDRESDIEWERKQNGQPFDCHWVQVNGECLYSLVLRVLLISALNGKCMIRATLYGQTTQPYTHAKRKHKQHNVSWLARTYTHTETSSLCGVHEQFKEYVRHEHDSFGLLTKCTEIETATYGIQWLYQININL